MTWDTHEDQSSFDEFEESDDEEEEEEALEDHPEVESGMLDGSAPPWEDE